MGATFAGSGVAFAPPDPDAGEGEHGDNNAEDYDKDAVGQAADGGHVQGEEPAGDGFASCHAGGGVEAVELAGVAIEPEACSGVASADVV